MRCIRYGRTIINNKCRLDYSAAQVCEWRGSHCNLAPRFAPKIELHNSAAQGIIDERITNEEQLEERYRFRASSSRLHFILFIPGNARVDTDLNYAIRCLVTTPTRCKPLIFSPSGHPAVFPSPESSATSSSCSHWHFLCVRVAWQPAAST